MGHSWPSWNPCPVFFASISPSTFSLWSTRDFPWLHSCSCYLSSKLYQRILVYFFSPSSTYAKVSSEAPLDFFKQIVGQILSFTCLTLVNCLPHKSFYYSGLCWRLWHHPSSCLLDQSRPDLIHSSWHSGVLQQIRFNWAWYLLMSMKEGFLSSHDDSFASLSLVFLGIANFEDYGMSWEFDELGHSPSKRTKSIINDLQQHFNLYFLEPSLHRLLKCRHFWQLPVPQSL